MKNNKKKKICFLSYRKIRCTVVDNFSKAAYRAGYDVSVIKLRNGSDPEFEIDYGRKFYRVSLIDRYQVASIINQIIFLLKAIKIINRNRYSIIQITSTCPYFILIKLFSFVYAKSIFHILSYPIANVHRKSLRRMLITAVQCYFMDKIVVQSEELKKSWVGLRKLQKAVVIPVGFNRRDFYPVEKNQRLRIRAELGIEENEKVLVYCGAIAHHRKIDRLIKAFNQIAFNHEGLKLLMIGDGLALADMQALTKRLNIEDRVIFFGRIPHTDVRNLIAIADIGLSFVPVNNNYNFNPPLKTFEYMACGLATIATRTESNCKIIKDGCSGMLINDSPEDVAEAIEKLLLYEDLRFLLSKNARKSILKFDFNYIAHTSFIPLYKELIGRN